MFKMIMALGLVAVGLAGCGGVGTGGADTTGQQPPPTANSVPTCDSLVGQALTRAMEKESCTDGGEIQGTADVDCKRGTMVAFGNVVGGYVGQPVRKGNFADWPGCLD